MLPCSLYHSKPCIPHALLMAYYSNDDGMVTSLLVSSQISDGKIQLPMDSSVELIFGNVSFY